MSWDAAILAAALYLLRMWAICAGLHRYFSHRAFSTSRVFQFVLAFLAQTSAQNGALWWAANHRTHHLHSDTIRDIHSPKRHGFFHAHIGWVFVRGQNHIDLRKVRDFAKFPELVWIQKHDVICAVFLGVVAFLIGGWRGLVIGFFWSTVVLYHATFCINSLAHVLGRQRYVTGDDSRNNFLLALFTLGEGWHNNHHAYPVSARQGFRWWEIDPTFYSLKVLSWFGLVWDLKMPPQSVLKNRHRLGSRTIERAAADLAGSFDADSIARKLGPALAEAPEFQGLIHELAEAAKDGRHALEQSAHLPTRQDVRAKALATFAHTVSLDHIVERAYSILLARVVARMTFIEPRESGSAEMLARVS